MFEQRNSYKFADELRNITQSINATPKRSLGNMAPVNVTKDTQKEARFNAFLERTRRDKLADKRKSSIKKGKTKRMQYKFKVNDRVRISHLKHTYTLREYDQKWTGGYNPQISS